ncbi:hypothetical protein HZU84_16345, partial [Sphaerotilus natans subsp. sulfidivorans]|nr:hypothetical protein [Sphaerotilus sulfidivorans]
AFSAYFKGVEMLTENTRELPEDWLRRMLERELSAEERTRRLAAALAGADAGGD